MKVNDRCTVQFIKLFEVGHVLPGIGECTLDDVNMHGEHVLIYHQLVNRTL